MTPEQLKELEDAPLLEPRDVYDAFLVDALPWPGGGVVAVYDADALVAHDAEWFCFNIEPVLAYMGPRAPVMRWRARCPPV